MEKEVFEGEFGEHLRQLAVQFNLSDFQDLDADPALRSIKRPDYALGGVIFEVCNISKQHFASTTDKFLQSMNDNATWGDIRIDEFLSVLKNKKKYKQLRNSKKLGLTGRKVLVICTETLKPFANDCALSAIRGDIQYTFVFKDDKVVSYSAKLITSDCGNGNFMSRVENQIIDGVLLCGNYSFENMIFVKRKNTVFPDWFGASLGKNEDKVYSELT